MAFQPVPDTAAIDIIYTQQGEVMQNTFYAEKPGGYVLGDLIALAAAVDAQVQGTWKTQQVIEAFYERTEVRGLALANDLVATNNDSNGGGTNLAGALPANVTLVVKKGSGLTGRSARGRCYWIGTRADSLRSTDENRFTGAYALNVAAAVDSIRTAINTLPDWLPVLVSRFTNGAARPFGVTFTWVDSVTVNDVVDTQRGRLPK